MNKFQNSIKLNNHNHNSPPKSIQKANDKNPVKKQKNVPAQIWAKRNILKKLTLQLKFNKNETIQYKKIRTQIQDSIQDYTNKNQKNITLNLLKSNQNILPSNQNKMRKLCILKTQMEPKYIDNFFASTAFSINGLKSYHYKSVAFQGNNFINVSKANICEKSKQQKNKKHYTHRKLSFSYRERHQQNLPKQKHQRSRSLAQNYKCHENDEQKGKSDFLKVSTKKLHINSFENNDCETNNEQSFSMKRIKTETNNNFTLSLERRKMSQFQMKSNLIRPKSSCTVKAKKAIQFTCCQGWNTKNSARLQEDPFPNSFRFE